MVPVTVKTDAVSPAADESDAPGVPFTDDAMEALFDQEADRLAGGEQSPPADDKGEGETVSTETPEKTEGAAAADAGVEENKGESKSDPMQTLLERFSQLETKLAEATSAGKVKQETAEAEDFVAPKIDITKMNLTDDQKILLESAPGLDTLVSDIATQVATALFKQQATKQTVKASKEVEAVADTEFWGELQTWGKTKNPDLDLVAIRKTEDFNDWLSGHKSWADSQMAKAKDRRDTSGAKAVFERYIRESQLEAAAKPPENGKKLASARTPMSLSSRPTPSQATGDLDDLFNRESDRLVSAATKGRKFL